MEIHKKGFELSKEISILINTHNNGLSKRLDYEHEIKILNLEAIGSKLFFSTALVNIAIFLNGDEERLFVITKDYERSIALVTILKTIKDLLAPEELEEFKMEYKMFPTKSTDYNIKLFDIDINMKETELSTDNYTFMGGVSTFDYPKDATYILKLIRDIVVDKSENGYTNKLIPITLGMKYYHAQRLSKEYTLIDVYCPDNNSTIFTLTDIEDPFSDVIKIESCGLNGYPCPSRNYSSKLHQSRKAAYKNSLSFYEEKVRNLRLQKSYYEDN